MFEKFNKYLDKANPGLIVGLGIVLVICVCAGVTMTINNLENKLDEIENLEVSDISIEPEEVVEEEIIEEQIVEPEPEPEQVYEEPVYYEEVYYEPAPSYNYNTDGLTPQSGVNYYNDRKETYYSSNVLYHYRTDEWTVGEDGVYRDADGYVVVAASDLAQGETVDTSFGMGKVYDSGCAPGTTDIYTKW